MVCFDTPNSRATSSTLRPASTCFSAAIICASVCLLFDMLRPSPNTISYSVMCGFRGAGHGDEHEACGFEEISLYNNGHRIATKACAPSSRVLIRNEPTDMKVHRTGRKIVE